MKKINAKNKIIILIILFIVFIASLGYFIFYKYIINIKSLEKQILDEEKNLQIVKLQEKNADLFFSNIQSIESKIDDYNKLFINKNQELQFITTLENIADKNNVTQKIDLSFDEKNNNVKYSIIPIQISISGEFKNIINYLGDLENINYFIIIENLNLSSLSENQQGGRYSNMIDLNEGLEATTSKPAIINIGLSGLTFWK